MVYVIIYLQNSMNTETKKFRSIKSLMNYCYERFKPNYIVFEKAADNSFDYYVRLKNQLWD